MPGTIFEFGEFRLDCGRFELLRAGRSLTLERKPLELLILLAEKNGQLATREEIAQRLWQSEVFVDTEHGINTAIRKIRYALRDDAENSRYIQTVTGKGYRFAAPVQVLPEIEPDLRRAPESGVGSLKAVEEPVAAVGEEMKPDAAIERQQENEQGTGRLVRIAAGAAAGIAVLAGMTFGIVRWSESRSQSAAISSLAVIPLDNLSGDPAQDYVADGMTDELTTMLARDSTLRIVSRTSAMQYKRARRPLREIARALGVDGIVEGSIARSGEHVHLTLQLIRAATDSHIWAESYDRDTNDPALPDEAARAIAKRLNSAAATATPVRYVDPAAHEAYLKGRYLWFGSEEEARKYFQKAIEIQPDYAMAWAWLANCYGIGVVSDELDPRTNLKAMNDAATRALELDPNSPETHMTMAGTLFAARWDFAGADQEILRAISLDPNNAEAYHLRGWMLSALNRGPESIECERKAMELDPNEPPYGLMDRYISMRQYDAAIQDGQLRLMAHPNDSALLGRMREAYRRKGMYKEAVEYAVRFIEASGVHESAPALARAYKAGGYRGFVRLLLADRTRAAHSEYVSPLELATYHAELGEREPALALLEDAVQWKVPRVLWIQTDSAFDFLHADPRYRSLIQRMGLPPLY